MAIVSNVPGTTRDRRQGHGYLAGLPLNLIDTGGLDDRGAVSQNIQTQVAKAFEHSDVVLFMLDGRVGVTALDAHFAQWIRKVLRPSKNIGVDGKSKSLIVVANKTEGAHQSSKVMNTVSDALELGFGDPILISATHGDGLADLTVELLKEARARGKAEEVPTKAQKRKQFKDQAAATASESVEGGEGVSETATAKRVDISNKVPLEDRLIQLAIMGRPNVGKSTLLNAFVRDERSITGPMAGLTRDAVQAEWQHRDRQFRLVDTAGLTRIRTSKQLLEAVHEKKHTAVSELTGLAPRQSSRAGNCNAGPSLKLPGRDFANPELDPSQYSYQISEYSLLSALNALRFAQVVLLVVEGDQGRFTKLDLQLARKCLDEGRGLVIAANKSDVMDVEGISGKKYEEGVKEHIGTYLREFGEVPVVVSSGLMHRGIDRLLNTVIGVHDAWSRRVETGSLNSWLRDLLVTQPPPRVDGKLLNVKYITQVKTGPPTFALFSNHEELPIFFERFLKSNIQTAFNLQGVPIRFVIRKTKGVDVHRNRKLGGKAKPKGSGSKSSAAAAAGRSSKSPTGLGSWKSVSRGGSVKKGMVGPNRDRKYLQRRVAGIVRHKRKSVAGTGVASAYGVNGQGMTAKESAAAKANARNKAKDSKKKAASTAPSSPRTDRSSSSSPSAAPVKKGGGRVKKTKGGLKKKRDPRPSLKDAKKAAANKRHAAVAKKSPRGSKEQKSNRTAKGGERRH
eukprot:CAMPEP_0170409292 /NCGR_PEP_ID=MMETSP0117_2-20130122/29262_1 /TAXON_ID=400756 /ORGANISM="Durinskia baltica, Strain CSIRO CS-38" /LENGTH=734 /DNA_ID=CAMNT_0010666715 /DNA_START=221 /DNA_END=2425 /DNA_ORIENTATION=+